MNLKSDDEVDDLSGRMKDIIDTYRPDEDVATFLDSAKGKLGATVIDAVSCADKWAKWLSSAEHLSDKRCHAQLLGLAAIASNTAGCHADVEDMLKAAVDKLTLDQGTAREYLKYVEKAIGKQSSVVDWSVQWDLALQLDADFQSQAFACLTEHVAGSGLNKEAYLSRIDAAVQNLQRLPAEKGAEAINALFFALPHVGDVSTISSRFSLLLKTFIALPIDHRDVALPGFAAVNEWIANFPVSSVDPRNDPWITTGRPNSFNDVIES